MNPVQHLITLSLRGYQWAVSPVLHFLAGPLGGCRFTPTCSVYAAEAVRRHGAVRGSWLAVRRLMRCQPWGGCGHDPVPEKSARPGTECGCQISDCSVSRGGAGKAECFCPSGALSPK